MSDTVYEAYDGTDMKPNDVTKLYRAEIGVKRSTYASFSLSYKSCQLTQKVLLGSWPGVSSNSLEFIRSYNYHLDGMGSSGTVLARPHEANYKNN